MLSPRIIPCLLVRNNGLVKTINFQNPTYIGDPFNAVKIFNEKEVDELIVLDIDASFQKREPNYKMIENLAAECRMPLCYGGGIKTVDQIKKIIALGVEKVALGSAALEDLNLISDASNIFGSQSIVAVLDVKMTAGSYKTFLYNGLKKTGKSPFELAKHFEKLGAGEILLNSIDNDGVMKGYDFKIVEKMKRQLSVPLTVLGGAGSLNDIKDLIAKFGHLGAAAGSIFVYKGKYKAVLINYPSIEQKQSIIQE